MRVPIALPVSRDRLLHRETHGDVDPDCPKRWGFSETYAKWASCGDRIPGIGAG
jgi:hypothetical protein